MALWTNILALVYQYNARGGDGGGILGLSMLILGVLELSVPGLVVLGLSVSGLDVLVLGVRGFSHDDGVSTVYRSSFWTLHIALGKSFLGLLT